MTPEKQPPPSLTEKAVAAMQAAVAKVVEEHARTGRPLAVWRDGRVVMIPAREAAAVREEPNEYRTGANDEKDNA